MEINFLKAQNVKIMISTKNTLSKYPGVTPLSEGFLKTSFPNKSLLFTSQSTSQSNEIDESVWDIFNFLQDVQTVEEDSDVQAAIEDVLKASEKAEQNQRVQQDVDEFFQANQAILQSLGVPTADRETDVDEIESQDSTQILTEILAYPQLNPTCTCYDNSEIMNKIDELMSSFEFPKTVWDSSTPAMDLLTLKSMYGFKRFYTHYKAFIQASRRRSTIHHYSKNTDNFPALLGAIQDQFEQLHSQCLQKHPTKMIQEQLIRIQQDRFALNASFQSSRSNTDLSQNAGALYYFYRAYEHFKKGKISAYIEDIQNLMAYTSCNRKNLNDLGRFYSQFSDNEKDSLNLYTNSIEKFIEYLQKESPQNETESAFKFILSEAKNMELEVPWKNALEYESITQILKSSFPSIAGAASGQSYSSQYHKIDGKICEHTEFAIINGINNELSDALSFGETLKNHSGGHRVHVLFNATQGKLPDLMHWWMAYIGNQLTPAVALTIQFIRDHFSKYPNKKLYLVSHSCGGAVLKAALKEIPPEQRQKIVIRNMGGGAYIPKALCENAINFVSKNDMVSFLSHLVGTTYMNSKAPTPTSDYEFRILEPKPGSPKIDHNIQSPTYQEAIEKDVAEFLNTNS